MFDKAVSCAGVTRFPCSSHLLLQPVRKMDVLRFFFKKEINKILNIQKKWICQSKVWTSKYSYLRQKLDCTWVFQAQLEFVTEVQMPFFFFHHIWKNYSLKTLWTVPYSWKRLGTIPAWQTFPSSTSCTPGMIRTEVNLQLNLVQLKRAFGRAMAGRNTTFY